MRTRLALMLKRKKIKIVESLKRKEKVWQVIEYAAKFMSFFG